MPISKKEIRFLYESNKIEEELSALALMDAIEAWSYAKLHLDKVYDYEYVLNIHKLLAKHLRPDIAGELRRCTVYIGGRAKLYTGEGVLKQEVKDWCQASKNLFAEAEPGNLEWIVKNLHVKFEDIHPFEDFNGRTGRILMNAHRVANKMGVSVINDKEKYQYYKWFDI